VRSDVLQKHPAAKLRVLVVWFDMMAGDSRQITDLRLFSDRRAANFWDQDHVAGHWFAVNVDGYDGIAWDQYYLYGAGAAWTDRPGPLLSEGGPVIGSRGDLEAALTPLLK
jgi:hypothetical protein